MDKTMETTTRPTKRFAIIMLLHKTVMLAVIPFLLVLHLFFKILGKTINGLVRYATSL
jgi:hypothetical protein